MRELSLYSYVYFKSYYDERTIEEKIINLSTRQRFFEEVIQTSRNTIPTDCKMLRLFSNFKPFTKYLELII
jgi:hypothetical protein